MQYTRQVQYLHSQLAPAVPIDSFIDAIKPAALGLTDKSQFYAPVRFAVQICGGINAAAGAIRVDVPIHANERWLDDMKKRFAGMIGLKNSLQGSDISFRTVAGQDISTIDQQHLPRVGKLNVYVGEKKIRLPAMPAIPVEYSVCKEANIQAWLQQVSAELPDLIARELVAQKNLTQLDAAVRGDGPVLKLIQRHLVESSPSASARGGGGWGEFLRTHHMNSPDRIGSSEAQATLVSVSKDMLSNLRRFIEASAEPIGSYISHLDAKRIASDLSKRSEQDVDHYKPLLAFAVPGSAGNGNIDGHELYRKIAEDALASPFVQQAIIATVYTRPLEAGCRWSMDDEKKLRGKTAKSWQEKTLSQKERDALARAVKETKKKLDEAKTQTERDVLRKQLAAERAKEKALDAETKKREAEYDRLLKVGGGDFGSDPQGFLKSRADQIPAGNVTAFVKRNGRTTLEKFEPLTVQIIAAKLGISAREGVFTYVPFSQYVPYLELGAKSKEQLINEIMAKIEENDSVIAAKKSTVKQEEVPEATTQPVVEEESSSSSSSSDQEENLENAKTSKNEVSSSEENVLSEDEQNELSDDEPDKNSSAVSEEKKWKNITAAREYFKSKNDFTKDDVNNYARQFISNKNVWLGFNRDILVRMVQLLIKEAPAMYNDTNTKEKLSKTLQRYYTSFLTKNRIGAHHPWNAQIHHTLQPLADGVYPTYYNLLHTKQDMSKDAAFAGDVVETYKAYHMFSGLPISPPGLVVEPIAKRAAGGGGGRRSKKKSGKWNDSSDDDNNKFHRMKSEMPPLIPLGDHAGLEPIQCGSCGGGHSSSSDDEPQDETMMSMIRGNLPPLERIDCGMSSDEDDEDEKKKRIGSSIAPPVVPLNGMPKLVPISTSIPPRPPLVRLSDVQAKIRSRLVPISDDMQDIESSDSMANEDIGDAYGLPSCSDVFGD